MAWSSTREVEPPFALVGMAKPTLHRDLPRLAKDYDVVIIDGAPRVNELGRSAILASDNVLIPVQPRPMTCGRRPTRSQLIREARVMKEHLDAAFVVNRRIARTAIGRDAADALAQFEDVRVLARPASARHLCRERRQGARRRRGCAVERSRARDRSPCRRSARGNAEEGGMSRKSVPFSVPEGATRPAGDRRRPREPEFIDPIPTTG